MRLYTLIHVADARKHWNMLDDLLDAIAKVRDKVSQHRALLKQNEIRTRTVLIDPILCALGWDDTDPTTVSVEYTTEPGPVDYALLRDSKPIAIVEAKRLDEPLKKHEMQMLTYAMAQGIKYALLTDGDTWVMFDVFHVAGMADKRLLNIKLSTMSPPLSALRLLALWNSSLQFGESISPAKSIVVGPGPEPPGDDWLSLSNYNPKPHTPCPRQIRFWDGTVSELYTWRDIVLLFVQKAFKDGYLDTAMLPLGTNKKNYIGLSSKNPDGSEMFSPHEVAGSPIVVELNMSASSARTRVRKLLDRCGLDAGSVHLLP